MHVVLLDMDITFNQSRILPEVILNVLGLLKADKGLDSWKLSRTVAKNFSLSTDHVPATGSPVFARTV